MKSVPDWRTSIKMRQYTIKISDLAEHDLENAGNQIAFEQLDPAAAEDTIKGIRERGNELQYFPESCVLEDDPVLAELGIHKTYFKEYELFYQIDHGTNTVYIVRILHLSMDSRAWLFRTFGLST